MLWWRRGPSHSAVGLFVRLGLQFCRSGKVECALELMFRLFGVGAENAALRSVLLAAEPSLSAYSAEMLEDEYGPTRAFKVFRHWRGKT